MKIKRISESLNEDTFRIDDYMTYKPDMINHVKEKIEWLQELYKSENYLTDSYNLPGIGVVYIDGDIIDGVFKIESIKCDVSDYWYKIFQIIGIMNNIDVSLS